MSFWNKGSALQPAQSVDLVKAPGGASAVDLTKVRESGHIDLAKKADKAGIELSKRGLSGIRARVLLILDHSGSMAKDYMDGQVQALVERVLGFALQVAIDGVTILPFDTNLLPAVQVGAAAGPSRGIVDYRDAVNKYIWRGRNNMGSTNMAAPLEAARQMITNSTDLWFIAFATDGEPDHNVKARTTELICDLSRYQAFVKFLALRPVNYLNELDNLPDGKRLLDNVNAQPHTANDGRPMVDLLNCTDLEFASAMAEEWDEWIIRAQKAGVLR